MRAFLSALTLAIAASLHNGSVSANEYPLSDSVWKGHEVSPRNGLPDGTFAISTNTNGQEVAAWYGSPTTRYRHGILGDAVEAGSLHVEYRGGQRYEFQLPDSQVFEDRTPRIVDLDRDGRLEIVTIRSYRNAGASVAVFGVRNGELVVLASTAAIGRSNRWLNIAGIEDYAGRGSLQIAYVETPHIGGTLHFVEWSGNKLQPIASTFGASNHEIGSRDQDLSADVDYDKDNQLDIVVPSNDRRTLRTFGFSGGQLVELSAVPLSSPVARRAKADETQKTGCVHFELRNRSTFEFCRP
ncbi:MAG: hypothetical protein AAGA50_27810 [Pseudomonadota bacterium]